MRLYAGVCRDRFEREHVMVELYEKACCDRALKKHGL